MSAKSSTKHVINCGRIIRLMADCGGRTVTITKRSGKVPEGNRWMVELWDEDDSASAPIATGFGANVDPAVLHCHEVYMKSLDR